MSGAPIEPNDVGARPVWPTLLLVAVIVTVLNAVKPLTMDDSAYFAYARQIAAHPLDPYGFQIFWAQWPEPANWLLAPPVIPYWWAIAIKFFGPSVIIWKLWLLPWIAAFVFAVHALLRRFSPAVAMPMTVFTAFAPVYLPAINYMLDVPALGLGLLALTVAMRAIDRRSIGLILLAGVMFGVSLQTKYTVATLPAVAALYGFSRQRFVFAVVPGFVAVAVFAVWEILIAHRYGHSHFVLHLHGPDLLEGKDPKYFLIVGAITLMGTLAGPLALLIGQSIGAKPVVLFIGACVIVWAYAAIVVAPVGLVVFGLLGIGVCGACAIALWKLVRRPTNIDDRFLLAWFAVEAAAFLAISPFTASRRLMGLLLILTLVTARLLDPKIDSLTAAKTLGRLVTFGVLVGLLFFTVDVLDARAEQRVASEAAAKVATLAKPGQCVYFVGHWGFQFYCEQAGLLPLIPDHTELMPGDWIIAARSAVNGQLVKLPPRESPVVEVLTADDPIGLETIPAFYGRLLAIDHRSGPRLNVDIRQVRTPFVPATDLPDAFVASWAITRPMPLMPASIPAVLRALRSCDATTADAVKRMIVASGPEARREASHDGDPKIRQWAIGEGSR